jgi:hypothetical protein
MAKIVLGAAPKSFKKKLSVPLLDGTVGDITLTYKYRTRAAFAEFVDSLFKEAGVTPTGQADEEVKFSLAQALAKATDSNADYILQIVEGWDLDAEFNRLSVAQLCTELPGVAVAIIDTYRQACVEGRLGN